MPEIVGQIKSMETHKKEGFLVIILMEWGIVQIRKFYLTSRTGWSFIILNFLHADTGLKKKKYCGIVTT